MMTNLFIILAFAILLPASTICGENVSENKSNSKDTSTSHLIHKSNSSSHSLSSKFIVKREIPDANLMPYYRIPTGIMSKRSATVLNKLMYALRNSFERSPYQPDMEFGSRENSNFSGDGPPGVARDTNVDRFPAALVERRGQKDRKYLRCYFNAVSCFKKK